jgi:alpha-tubulin suppressor-like RCC1 family protein
MMAVRKLGTFWRVLSILIASAAVAGVSGVAGSAAASADPQVAASTLANVLSVAGNNNTGSVGGSHCALFSTTGRVKCWGEGGYGELGNRTTKNSDVPVAVTGITDAKAVASDTFGSSFCAVLSTGGVKCWGDNYYGQLGNGTTVKYSDVPVSVKNITTATAITGGNGADTYGYCALLSTKHIDCWGYGLNGELGNGTLTISHVPVPVKNITNAATLISGHAGYCAVLSTGHMSCWGYGDDGELGNGTPTFESDVPVAVTGITDVTAVASDDNLGSYCAVLSTGQVKCWGTGGYGELGNGTTKGSDKPVAVTGITDATAVASDGDGESYCAVLSTGHMNCWGYNVDGELGDGTAAQSDVPVAVNNVTTATAVVGSAYGFCALLSTEHVDCWGDNFEGELGDGTTVPDSDVPVAVHTITNAATLIRGIYGFCALLTTSHVDCWGYDFDGELGDGIFTTYSDVPVAVLAGS